MTEKYHQMKLEEARRAEEKQNAELIRYNVENGNLSEQSEEPIRATTAVIKGKYFVANGMIFLAITYIPAGDIITPGNNCTHIRVSDALNALIS